MIIRLQGEHEPFQRFIERLYAALLGTEPGVEARFHAAMLSSAISVAVMHPLVADLDAGELGERAVVELHDDALERLQGLLDRGLDELEDHRLVGAEHRARGDAEEEGVTDLAGSAGHSDTNGSFHRVPAVKPQARGAHDGIVGPAPF